tara:strand:- start:29 stop:457 length:429 start_codon:yes stop_codon:yes gene_type:complete
MSYLKTKQALITQLLATPMTGVTGADIAFENNDFNPTGKSLWLACYFIPATSETLGKTTASSDEQRGIFQVSIFVALNSINYDNAQLTAIDEILSGFLYNTNIVYNGQKVDILTSEVNNGSESEAWYQRDISINYLTFSERV